VQRSALTIAPIRIAFWAVAITPVTATVVGVRFWIGTQDAKGSIKAKAEPMPAGSKLLVEVEDVKGARSIASFELKN
jgi:hypothetical protein